MGRYFRHRKRRRLLIESRGGERLLDYVDDISTLLNAQLGIYRQGKEFVGSLLRNLERSAAIAETAVSLLKMHRNGIVNAASDAGLVQMREERVALRDANGIDVVNMFSPFCFDRSDDRRKLPEGIVVRYGVLTTERIPPVQLPQLHLEHSSLDSIHATIPADHLVVIFSRLAVIAKDTNFFIDSSVVCDHPSRFAEGSEVFAWVETEAASVAQRPSSLTFVFRAVGLGSILDHQQTPSTGELQNRIHVGCLTKQMDRNDRLCP